jgi:AraC family ethanolamine operon transcriptional activator
MSNGAQDPSQETTPIPDFRPKIFRFSDIDQFRSAVRGINVDFTPLVRNISAEQIILNLPGCDVNFTKPFPRIVDAQLQPNTTAIGFTMDDGIPIRFNGVERDRSVVVIGSNSAVYNAVEKVERRYASIVFSPSIDDRGWPSASGGNFNMFETSPIAQQRLRDLVVHVLATARQFDASMDMRAAAAAMRESLLAGVDSVVADIIPTKWASHANAARQFRIFQDVRAVLAGSLGRPIYSEELAQQVGVSVRSMHDAVLRYRGMSLHRYLRLRRLWLVRQRLREGTHSVKACALAFGFWHLGDFARSYRSEFGETPSQTVARAR